MSKVIILTATCVTGVLFFSGCATDALTQSAIESLEHSVVENLPSSSLKGDALKGYSQALPAALPALTNPATLGVSAITGAMDAKQKRENLKAFKKLQDPHAMERLIVEKYNEKYGTNFTTVQEVQEDAQKREN